MNQRCCFPLSSFAEAAWPQRIVLVAGIFALMISCGSTWGLGQAPGRSPDGSRPGVEALLKRLGETRIPTSAAISPDASTVAWTLGGVNGTQIHLSRIGSGGAASGETDQILAVGGHAGSCDSVDPVWSPDGASLAFRSSCTGDAAEGQQQVFLWSKKTGTTRQLSHVTGALHGLAWSPDGTRIGLLFVENATRSAGALAAMKPWSGVIGEDGVEVQRVGVVEVGPGSFTQVTPRTLHVYEFGWAPDSKAMTYVAAAPPGENNWWIAKIYTQQVRGGSAGEANEGSPVVLVDTARLQGSLHGLQVAVPRWSPDGSTIAFIGGLMSDQGATGGDIYLVAAKGGDPRDLTPGRAASVASIAWRSEGEIQLAEHVGGSSHLAVLDVQSGRDRPSPTLTLAETIGGGDNVMEISSATPGGDKVAMIRSSFERAPEVWAGRLQDLQQVTHLNDGIVPAWGKTENITWTSDGRAVQGWLLYPAGWKGEEATAGRRYPLLVSVHGGPSSAVTPRWPSVGYSGVPFSAMGYFVFMPNPRGSYGQGEAFTQANVRDFGYGDLRDILAGMDTLEKRLPIDRAREGVTGWSYGGFMTMFAVTQTTRFRAAVAGAGISDWKSYYGENSIDQWMVPFFGGSVYDDPAIYAKSSAIDFIRKVKTPTLVVVGDRDGECPAPQSFEFWHALRAMGVPTELVVYPNEGHAFRDPEHRRDVLERALRWFDREMPAATGSGSPLAAGAPSRF